MKVSELMSSSPATCTGETGIRDISTMMVDRDCGMIPVLDDGGFALGTVTDRDIVCRTIFEGRNPLDASAQDVMSSPCVSISADAEVDEAESLMEQHQIRRLVVTNRDGTCCGVLAQADIAQHRPANEAAEMLREVSAPNGGGRF